MLLKTSLYILIFINKVILDENKTQVNKECVMDVGLIFDQSIVQKLSWSDNTLDNILKQIDPKENGNKTALAIFGTNSTINVNFSNEASTNSNKFLNIFKESKNYTDTDFVKLLDIVVRGIFMPNMTRNNSCKLIIFILENRTLESFSEHCRMCVEWVLQNYINFYIIETESNVNEKPLTINWLKETNYYSLKTLKSIRDILPTIFDLACKNNFTTNSAIFLNNPAVSKSDVIKRNSIKRKIRDYTLEQLKALEFNENLENQKSNCNIESNYIKKGCYNREIKFKMNEPLLIRNCTAILCKRDYNTMKNILCACSERAMNLNSSIFGVNKYGFCFHSIIPIKNTELQNLKKFAYDCHNTEGKYCNKDEDICYGGRNSILLYSIKPPKYSLFENDENS